MAFFKHLCNINFLYLNISTNKYLGMTNWKEKKNITFTNDNFLWFFVGTIKRKGNMIPLWDGRIIVSSNKKKEEKKAESSKNFKICTSSTGEIGFCTRLGHCKGFKLASLRNNLCFLDIFLPGVCCVQEINV